MVKIKGKKKLEIKNKELEKKLDNLFDKMYDLERKLILENVDLVQEFSKGATSLKFFNHIKRIKNHIYTYMDYFKEENKIKKELEGKDE